MARPHFDLPVRLGALAVLAAAACLAALPACEAPFGLDLPSTLALESGAAGGISGSGSFEIVGTYISSGAPWSIDLRLKPGGSLTPRLEHLLASQGSTHIEAIIVDTNAYFRGPDFLAQHLGTASAARTLVAAAGNAWWRGSATDVPNMADFTDGARLRAVFLGTNVTQRTDHVAIDGQDAADLSGPRADIYIAEAAPHQLLRLRMKAQATMDGIRDGDLHYSHFGTNFGIVAPTDVIDFSNLSTLPPLYTVVSVDASGCANPCVVSALLKNLGGSKGAKAPSTVTFSVTDSASGSVVGSCIATVQPDVGYNATTTVSCTIDLHGLSETAAIVTATPDNPGHA